MMQSDRGIEERVVFNTRKRRRYFMKRSLSLFVLLFIVVQSFVWTAAPRDKALYENAIHTARQKYGKRYRPGRHHQRRLRSWITGRSFIPKVSGCGTGKTHCRLERTPSSILVRSARFSRPPPFFCWWMTAGWN